MKKSKKVVLKVGQGLHSHVMECKKDVQYEEGDNFVKLVLKDTGIITHEEHEHIVEIPEGTYVSTSMVEYDPFIRTIRNIYD